MDDATFRTRAKLYMETCAQEPLVAHNSFRIPASPSRPAIPTFLGSEPILPKPFWEGHESAIACYWKVWELAFGNLRRVTPESGFPADYIDTAFNDCVFLWDSVFILQFARYGSRAFDFQRTLDCLYSKQHADGCICREIRSDGTDQWQRYDPASTGPNLFAWSEWNYFQVFQDLDRLRRVYPVIAAYHRWMKRFRSWPDGSYWSCGLGCGMDNQPRVSEGADEGCDPGHLSWQDACFQAVLSARLLGQIAEQIGEDGSEFCREATELSRWCMDNLWSGERGFFFDRQANGVLSATKTVGAFWSLLSLDLGPEHIEALCRELNNPATFNRFHRIPSLSADHPLYDPRGGYWCGGVWPPTNYMVLQGLTKVGRDDLAYEIARNHHQRVVEQFEQTQTVWENYSPESLLPALPAKRDLVGWGGIGPVAVLFEYVFGLRPDPLEDKLVWDIRLTETFGVDRYPFGAEGLLDLRCEARSDPTAEPAVTVTANRPIAVEVRWSGGAKTVHVQPH